MSAQELHWDRNENPSEVKGVIDLREATIGSATFNTVRFHDVVDFSRTRFGQYKIEDEHYKEQVMKHASTHVIFENNTFEKEADFLHVTFSGSALLMDNRFRSTLDLTGALFAAPDANLCLSYNRINRFVLGPENLGSSANFFHYRSLLSIFERPLHKSRIRQIAFKKTSAYANLVAPQCVTLHQQETTPDNTVPQGESLNAIYKTIGQAFREANDQGGLNEAWYLQKVVEQNQQRIDSPISYWLSRVLLGSSHGLTYWVNNFCSNSCGFI